MIKIYYTITKHESNTTIKFLNYNLHFNINNDEISQKNIYNKLIEALQEHINKEYKSPIFIERWTQIPKNCEILVLSKLHYLKILTFNEYVINKTPLADFNSFMEKENFTTMMKIFDLNHKTNFNTLFNILENGYNKNISIEVA